MLVLEGEVVALLEALHFATTNCRKKVFLKFDSSTLVDTLSSNYGGAFEFHDIVAYIISKLSLYPNFEVKFIR